MFLTRSIHPSSLPLEDLKNAQTWKIPSSFALLRIRIEGQTDDVGTSAYNQKLSSDRANAVLKYLVNNGISSDRLVAVGKGASVPIATNDDEEGRKINRRVEIVFLNWKPVSDGEAFNWLASGGDGWVKDLGEEQSIVLGQDRYKGDTD